MAILGEILLLQTNVGMDAKESGMETEDKLRERVDELATEVSRLKRVRNFSYIVVILGTLVAGLVGWVSGQLGRRTTMIPESIGRVETGTVPIELNGELAVTGVVEFTKPFLRRPLVFVAEAGHAGVFLACKTDAISETQFTWAAGAGPMRRPYKSELAWIAIEPK